MPAPSVLVRQVGALLDRHPGARLVVFVPRPQLGTALQQAVVRERGSTAGLRATTLERYAHDLAALSLRADGRSELDVGPQFFLTATAVERLTDEQQATLTGDQPLSGMIAPLARTFATLREHRVTPEAHRRRVATSPRQQAQAQAFDHYEDLLREHDHFDTADLFQRAENLVRENQIDRSPAISAILGDVSVSTVERSFVECLEQKAAVDPGLYRIGPHTESSKEAAPPPRSATAQFADAPMPSPTAPSALGRIALVPGANLSEPEAQSLRFWTATGTRREVQAVFDDILEHDRPLDTVEIAYTSPAPYLPLLDTLAERYEIPISLSSGRSIDATRPGQALRGFFDWIAGGCPIPDLIGLLRAGLLRSDKPRGPDASAPRLDSARAASLLAEKRYPDDCQNYAATFEAWAETLASEAANIVNSVEAEWGASTLQKVRQKKAAVETLGEVVEDLLGYAQMEDRSAVRPMALAKGAENMLEAYGPTPKPTDGEDDHTPDEAARNRLIERLRSVTERAAATPLPVRRLANRMTTWMGLSPYVGAQRPQPGRAHVVPLESAGFADRNHLYVLGLDAASTTSALPDDPLLTDEEREALSDDDRALPLRSAQADAEAWRTRRALARHEGPVTLSASTYDLGEGEDLFEAPLFLRLKEAAQAARGVERDENDPNVAHHALAPDRDTLLSDLDRWTSRVPPSPDALDEAFSDRFPWIRDGLDAAAARDSDSYTAHDGLLSARDYPGLDPLSGTQPVSAGKLEAYAQAPYAYFLRYVLDVEPLDEPALDDVAWLDALGRGSVLHDTFRRFMADLGRRPTLDDEPRLRDVFDAVLDEKRAELPPPSEVVFASTRRQLWNDALLFLRTEAARPDEHTPHAFELGFGYPPHRRQDDDYPDAPILELGDLSFPLRGRIDRVDRFPDGSFGVWDYKTGSSRSYDETDLLDDRHLQWALYAYAFEALDDATVATAGYFFTSTDEMDKRIAAHPDACRTAVARILRQISDGITAGAFPVTDADAIRYNYDRLFQNYSDRRKQLNAKSWPDERPAPPALQDD